MRRIRIIATYRAPPAMSCQKEASTAEPAVLAGRNAERRAKVFREVVLIRKACRKRHVDERPLRGCERGGRTAQPCDPRELGGRAAVKLTERPVQMRSMNADLAAELRERHAGGRVQNLGSPRQPLRFRAATAVL